MDDTATALTSRRDDAAVDARLHRIEGQACGLRRMHEAGRPTEALLDQIGALRGALLGLGLVLAGREVADRIGAGRPGPHPTCPSDDEVSALLHRLVRP